MSIILAIDDNGDNLISIKALLKLFVPGAEVVTAQSGKEGIDAALSVQPDVILLDIHMPGMDGFEVCKRLKDHPATGHIPIVILTAVKTDSRHRAKALNLGADAFLTKPVDETALAAQVKAMLRIKKAEDILRNEKDALKEEVRLRMDELIDANEKLLAEIIERKRAEETLRKSEARFKKMIEKSPLPMVITDENHDILQFNEKFTELFGYTLEDVATAEEWWSAAYPDEAYRERVRQAWVDAAEEAERLKTDIAVQEWDITVKDGTVRSCEFYMVPLGDVSLIVMKDNTEKKLGERQLWESKERFQKIFNSQLDAIFVLDNANPPIVVDCNSVAVDIFGYGLSELIGDTVNKLHVDDAHLKTFQEILFPEIRKQGFLKDTGFFMKRKSGEVFPTEHVVLEVNDDTGNRTGWISIVRDRTEHKQLETRLQQAQKMEAIGTLAGGIAHDFNNILSPLLGFTEMIQEDLPPESPLQENVTEVLQAGLRAKDLVKQILAFSRQSAAELKPVKLQSVLREPLKLLRSSIPRTIDIHTHIDPECGVVVADPTQVHQVVMNLATNAYHAMDKTGGALKISLAETDVTAGNPRFSELLPGRYALLEVSDTGAGIEKEMLDRIFDPYFTTKPKDRGTGLGLSVVQGIVKRCGGDIRIESEPGRGTKVAVYLPLMKKAVPAAETEAPGPAPRGNEIILLVDDETAIIKMQQMMLERLGYRVISRSESMEALALFRENPDKIDLVITDMTMPNMTGVELAEEMRKIRADIPVIVCTGFSDRINEESSRRMGVQGYVTKPVIKSEIARAIRSVLDGPVS